MSYYESNIRRCQHIKVNGLQCGSPALKRNRLCFFHKRWREQRIVINSARRRQTPAALDLPVLEDANSIQVALMQVMRLLLGGQLDLKTAGMLLYGLQTASSNLRHTSFEHLIKTRCVIDPSRVAETELDGNPWSDDDFPEDDVHEKEETEQPANAEAAPTPAENELIEQLEAALRRKPPAINPPDKEQIRRQIRNTLIQLLPRTAATPFSEPVGLAPDSSW